MSKSKRWAWGPLKVAKFGCLIALDARGVVWARPLGTNGQAVDSWTEVEMDAIDADFKQCITTTLCPGEVVR